jgi:hypothetical protein
MRIFFVESSDDLLNYKYISDNIKLQDLNRILEGITEHKINGNDISMMNLYGGTVVCYDKINNTYIIDLDYDKNDSLFTEYLHKKFENLRSSIKRDIKINSVI